MCSQKRNCTATVPISTVMCLWANYRFPGSVHNPHINLQQNMQTDGGNIYIAHSHMNVEIGTFAAQLLFWEYFSRSFGIVSFQCNKYNGLSTGRSWWLWETERAVRPACSSSSAETSSQRYQTHPTISSGSATGPRATKLQARSQPVSLLFSVLEALASEKPLFCFGKLHKNAPKNIRNSTLRCYSTDIQSCQDVSYTDVYTNLLTSIRGQWRCFYVTMQIKQRII